MASTPLRNIRVDDDLWTAVADKARDEGTTASALIRVLLTRYISR